MKKLMAAALGLGLVLGSISFAAQDTSSTDTSAKKHKKSKKSKKGSSDSSSTSKM